METIIQKIERLATEYTRGSGSMDRDILRNELEILVILAKLEAIKQLENKTK